MSEITNEFDKFVEEERLREVAEGVGIEARRARYALRRKKVDAKACPEGHEYTPENTHYEATTHRRRHCITCMQNKRSYTDPALPSGRVKGEE